MDKTARFLIFLLLGLCGLLAASLNSVLHDPMDLLMGLVLWAVAMAALGVYFFVPRLNRNLRTALTVVVLIFCGAFSFSLLGIPTDAYRAYTECCYSENRWSRFAFHQKVRHGVVVIKPFE